MRRVTIEAWLARGLRLGALAALAAAWQLSPTSAHASSHREAPFVSKNPKVDGTDFYAFESYEAGHKGMVTFIANYQPLQDAFGGPNYFGMDDNALYEIMIDNDGDGVEDLTFQFQFQTALANGGKGLSLHIGPDGGGAEIAVPFYNVGLIPGDGGALNVLETYSVTLVHGPRRTGGGVLVLTQEGNESFGKPADNVGVSSFGKGTGYADYAKSFVYSHVTVPNCGAADAGKAQVFVGQRAESFAVNLGPTFDLVDLPASVVTNGASAADYAKVKNPLEKKNITTIALEVPRDCIWQSLAQPIIGAWTTASVRQARVINPAATYEQPSVEGGAWTQVSRLGNPLVNEVVIGLPDKDKWNGSAPADDAQNFASYVNYPSLPAIIDVIFGTNFQPTAFPRADLVKAFLTGFSGINAFPPPDGGAGVPAEYIHLNTNTEAIVDLIHPNASPTPYATSGAQTQNRLGAAGCVPQGVVGLALASAGCDLFGYPNGRRPIDDVVDISLDVLEGYLLGSGAPAFAGTKPKNWTFFTDGVDQAATQFDDTFPYLTTPTQGANGNGT